MVRRSLQILALCCGALGLIAPAQAQYRFSAEALFMDANNGGARPLLNGPDSISSGGNTGFGNGYRFTLGGTYDAFDLELSAARVDNLNYSSSGTLVNPLIFDDTATNPLFAAPPPNTLAFVNSLYTAATTVAVEDTESERLKAGATWFTNGTLSFEDYQVNIGSNPNRNQWRFGLGYRQMRINGSNNVGISGTFDALDTLTGAAPGTPGDVPNNALTNDSLTGAGYSLFSGLGNGYDASSTPPTGPDTLLLYYESGASNALNGLQASGGYSLTPDSPVDLQLFGRAGIFHNQAQGRVGEYLVGSVNDDSVYRRTYNSSRGGVAFGGTLGAKAVVPLTDYISLTGGYEATYIANVALASSQLGGLSNSPIGVRRYTVHNGDKLLIHGATLGMTVTW